MRRAWSLFDNYALARLTGRPSTAAFWYTHDAPAIRSLAERDAYLAASQPRYLIDYRPKLAYPVRNAAGITALQYVEPIGQQVNPEAAFQVALGAHDAWLLDGDPAAQQTFLTHAAFFRDAQKPNGTWAYTFDWLANSAPWASALAQSRGASVMLRAASLTGERQFADAALAALRPLGVPIEEGGFRAIQNTPAGSAVYFEEYPKHPTAVLNGSMAALFGLYEAWKFLGDDAAGALWREGTAGMAWMLPQYDAGWWTVYDLDPAISRRNYDSPHYHAISTSYLALLALLDDEHRSLFEAWHHRWRRQATVRNRLRATLAKAHFKMTVR